MHRTGGRGAFSAADALFPPPPVMKQARLFPRLREPAITAKRVKREQAEQQLQRQRLAEAAEEALAEQAEQAEEAAAEEAYCQTIQEVEAAADCDDDDGSTCYPCGSEQKPLSSRKTKIKGCAACKRAADSIDPCDTEQFIKRKKV